MIARLTGRIAAIEPDGVVLDVGGVGYRVAVPASTLAALGGEQGDVTLHTRLQVRDSELVLFGAVDAPSLALFERLITVNGVGPRLALALLSVLDASSLPAAIVAGDLDALITAPGVGRKIAQRIVLELRPQLEAAGIVGGVGSAEQGFGGTGDDLDALAALTGLGYSAAEARRALVTADVPANAAVEDRIRAALRQLVRG